MVKNNAPYQNQNKHTLNNKNPRCIKWQIHNLQTHPILTKNKKTQKNGLFQNSKNPTPNPIEVFPY